MQTIGLVVALYNEDANWIHKLIEIPNIKIYIYLKNPERLPDIQNDFPNCIIEVLENQGRESHTYLYHIIKYYSNLESRTVFLQGNPFDHASLDIIINSINKNTNNFTGLFSSEPFICDKYGMPHHYLGDHIEYLYNIIFNKSCLEELIFYPGAQFIVPKENIMQHPVSLYNTILNHTFIHTIPYVLERLWGYIFKLPQPFYSQHVEG